MCRTIGLIAFFLFVFSACNNMTVGNKYPLVLGDHVLAGKIWDVKAGKFVEKQKLVEKSRQRKFILLGETHDNRLHHQYQAWLIDNLYKSGFSALVAFEMIDSAQGKLIENKQYKTSTDLISDLNRVKTTWQYETRYKPVFNSLLAAGYAVYPASLDRAAIMTIARKGHESIPAEIQSYLDKNKLTEAQKQSLREEIKASHCGMDNPQMTRTMMLIQRVKDAEMANSLMRDANEEKRVLVAGSGHTRLDRGVPIYITSSRKSDDILSIAWVEVAKELTTVEQYAERWGDKELPFDYVWFTARVDRPDPCIEFRHHMQLKKQNNGKDMKEK